MSSRRASVVSVGSWLLAVGSWLELQRPLLHPVGTHDRVKSEGVRPRQGHDAVDFDATDAQIVRPYRATYRFDTTDARPSVPTQGYSSHKTCQHLLFEEDGVVAYRVHYNP